MSFWKRLLPSRFSSHFLLGLFALYALCVLSPYLTTGYYHDDSLNSTLRGYLQWKQISLGTFIGQQNRHWIYEGGRFFPLTVSFLYLAWFLMESIAQYRIFQVGLVMSNLFLFVHLIRSFGGTQRLALLSGALLLGLFQLRNYHDPIASYCFHMQIGVGLGLGSILLLLQFKKTNHLRSLLGSLAVYAIALLTYETELTFLPVLLFLAFQVSSTPREGFKRGLARWGHLSLTALYLIIVAGFHWMYPPLYGGTRIHLGMKLLLTAIYQLSGTLPLIYAFFGRSGYYTFSTLWSGEFLSLQALGIAVFSGGFVLFLFKHLAPAAGLQNEGSPKGQTELNLRVFAWTLFLIPASFISISEKYQMELSRPGLSYLPVYISYFGLALLAGLALEKSRRPLLVSILVGLVTAFTFSTNKIAADRLNQFWKYPRTLIELALRDGILEGIPAGSRIVRGESDTWDWTHPDFILQYSDKSTVIKNVKESLLPQPIGPHEAVYWVDVRSLAEGEGRVVLAQMDQALWDGKNEETTHIFSSHPVRVLEYHHGVGHSGWIQKGGEKEPLDLKNPEFWNYPIQ